MNVTVAGAFETASLGFAHHVVDLYRRCGQVTDPCTTPCRKRRVLAATDEAYIGS